jgi:hypothetical protein
MISGFLIGRSSVPTHALTYRFSRGVPQNNNIVPDFLPHCLEKNARRNNRI